jgi:hypothetical protein
VRPASFSPGDDGEEDRGITRALPEGLVAIVALDTPERYVFPYASELREELGMDDAMIWDRAMSNLRERLDMTPPAYEPGRIMGIKTDVGLASSFLVEDAF